MLGTFEVLSKRFEEQRKSRVMEVINLQPFLLILL